MRLLSALAALAAALFSSVARAQTVVVTQGSGGIVVLPQGVATPTPAPAPGTPGAAATPSTPRQEKLKALEYDRRPSAILAAWSTPPKPPEPEPPPEATTEPETRPATETRPVEGPEMDPEAAAKAAEEERKKKEEAAAKAAEAKAIEEEMAALQRNVTLGDWAAVKAYLAGLTEEEKKAGYDRMLQSLGTPKPPQPVPNAPPQNQAYAEKNRFSPEDILGLADAAPLPLTKENLTALGKLLRLALDQGHQLEGFLDRVEPRLAEEGFVPSRRQLALLLAAANEPLFLGGLLPSAAEARETDDREALNLLAQHFLARNDRDKEVVWLENAWEATQAVLAVGEVTDEDKKEALKRAVDLAPKIRNELGQAWLDESFSTRPERGMEILAAIGSAGSTALATDFANAEKREKLLELQTTAAKALLAAAPDRAAEWTDALSLLADNWLKEAAVTIQFDDSTSLGPRMQRDVYGNIYYWNPMQMQRGNQPAAIRTGPLVEMRPGDEWIARVDETLAPRLHMVLAQLLLRVGEEEEAFPHIEEVAATHPKPAKDLADEFLRVWAKNHNPNEARNRANPYVYIYGFDERANAIPLTRSQQERNLEELGRWVARLRALSVEIDVELLATAFTTAHSAAEVFRLETIEGIFGSMDSLEPATLGELLEKMRANLATVWRDPALQRDKKTNRRPQDIQAEVFRGYELAEATIDRALADHPDRWELVLALAALRHDENDYRRELRNDPEFSTRREEAFGLFAKAADLYAAAVESLDRDEETTKVHETWFYAALGACDLGMINYERQLAAAQIPRIRAALESLPGDRAERHLAMFANALVTRMGSARPEVKFRYAREGLSITGDHKLVREVRQIYDYYNDLVTEIQLRASVDGTGRVGHGRPFGLHVDLRHTKEIERESGGFSKYLQNQNNAPFAWNYGRPLEDYRDKFEEATREALKESFEVLSVTFNDPKVTSKADPVYGWRVTPYAYVLLKSRGPQVDRVPALRLDLDFLDTSGYAVLPIESAVVPIDASDPAGDVRPCEELKLAQTLDERQAKDGKLILEVKATGVGLVPDLGDLLDVAPESFDVARTEDHGVSVVQFEEEGESNEIVSERTWTLTMRAREGLAELPESFTFATPKIEVAADERFRYVDADLEAVGPTVSLERAYGEPSRDWMWALLALPVAVVGAFFGWRRLRRPKAAAPDRHPLPDPLTPFTVLGLLRDIERENGFAPERRRELAQEIASIERHFFVEESGEPPDLRRIAETWIERAG